MNRSAIGTLVERTTRYAMLLRLPPMDGHGVEPPVKNGPPPAGHGAQAVREAIPSPLTTWPAQRRRSLTWDQGAETAQHARLRLDTGLEVYFADPHGDPTRTASGSRTKPAPAAAAGTRGSGSGPVR